MAHAPYTYKEAFARLDRNLKHDDKMVIAQMKDISELHMGLGMWVRNYWIYGHEEFLKDERPKDSDCISLMIPDIASEELLRKYRLYLRKRYKITPKK